MRASYKQLRRGTWLCFVRNAAKRQVQVLVLGEDVNKHVRRCRSVGVDPTGHTWSFQSLWALSGMSWPPSPRRGIERENLKMALQHTDSTSQIRTENQRPANSRQLLGACCDHMFQAISPYRMKRSVCVLNDQVGYSSDVRKRMFSLHH